MLAKSDALKTLPHSSSSSSTRSGFLPQNTTRSEHTSTRRGFMRDGRARGRARTTIHGRRRTNGCGDVQIRRGGECGYGTLARRSYGALRGESGRTGTRGETSGYRMLGRAQSQSIPELGQDLMDESTVAIPIARLLCGPRASSRFGSGRSCLTLQAACPVAGRAALELCLPRRPEFHTCSTYTATRAHGCVRGGGILHYNPHRRQLQVVAIRARKSRTVKTCGRIGKEMTRDAGGVGPSPRAGLLLWAVESMHPRRHRWA